jgi:tRNA(fMet)-specific endonuclease VapC
VSGLYLMDTCTVSDFIDRKEPLYSRVVAAGESVVITAVTLDESLTGWYNQIRKAKTPERRVSAYEQLVRTTLNLARLPILPYSMTAEAHFQRLRKLKLNVGSDDLRIAAIALEADATVVTANVRDFGRVPGLRVEDWTRPVQ